MKTLINLLMFATLAAPGVRADIISIVFDDPNQIGNPGQTLNFFGTITNIDANQGDAPVYLNGDVPNFTPPDATSNDNFLNLAFPVCDPVSLICSLAPGASSGDLDLFDITLADPESEPFGVYQGTYGLVGGMDGGTGNAQDLLTIANFSVDVEPLTSTPEPGTLPMLGGGMMGLGLLAWSRRRGMVE